MAETAEQAVDRKAAQKGGLLIERNAAVALEEGAAVQSALLLSIATSLKRLADVHGTRG